MAKVRRIIMGLVLAAIALLAVFSVVGAFLGADGAAAFFNSVPLVIYWMLLGLLLAVGFVFYRRLILSPSALAMHLGSLLILGGAMWGSDKAHDLRRAVFGSTKIASGFMAIEEGYAENRVMKRGSTEVVGELPFSLKLADFRIEYYPAKVKEWFLVVLAPVFDSAGQMVDEQQAEIPWQVGGEAAIPFTYARVKVLQYLESAVATYAPGAAPVIEITGPAGAAATLPAREGAEVDLADPPAKARVVRVLQNLRVNRTATGHEVVDAPGEGVNPAVEVELTLADGTRDSRYVLALMPMHDRDGGPEMRYVFPRPTGARADPAGGAPAMEVLLTCGNRERREWFLPRRDDTHTSLSLGPVLTGRPDDPEGPPQPTLFMAAPRGDISDYLSDLVVLEGDKPVGAKVIEVNDPLHYPAPWPPWDPARLARWWREGGYHFYQADYDHEAGRYTVLQVVSDSGLVAAYAGFFLLAAGTFGRFWIENPLRARLRSRGSRGD